MTNLQLPREVNSKLIEIKNENIAYSISFSQVQPIKMGNSHPAAQRSIAEQIAERQSRGVSNTEKGQLRREDPLERESLAAIYTATNGTNWFHRTYWNTARSLSNWRHVKTKDDHVVSIDLTDNRLSGFMPPFISLKRLQTLAIGFNELTGPVPWMSFTKSLPMLERLELAQNRFEGTIEWSIIFDNLKHLRVLDLANNMFTGERIFI